MRLGGLEYFQNWLFWSGFLHSVSNMQEFLYLRVSKGIFIVFIILAWFNLLSCSYPKCCCNIIVDLTKARMKKIHSGILVTINIRVQIGDFT